MKAARFPEEDTLIRLLRQQDDILGIIRTQGECIEHLQNQLTMLGELCLKSIKGGQEE